MFDRLAHSYRRIVKSIAIIEKDEEKIKERGIKKENLDFQCLFILPKTEENSYNSLIYNVISYNKNIVNVS